jgi:type IV pilus assembly protein PilC
LPEFLCKLGTSSGEVIERTFMAENLQALRSDLEQRDYLVFRIRRRSSLMAVLWPFGARKGKIKFKEFLVFNQEMEALVRAGLPVMSCLDILIERRKNPVLRKSLTEIREQVRSGASLSESFSAQGDLYPRIYSSSLASGERSGDIAGVLRRYIDFTKTMLALRTKVGNALVYPAVILVLACGLMGIMFYFVLPSFAEFYSDFDAELPMITKVLLGVSEFLRGNVLLVGGGLAVLVGFLSYLRNTRSGRSRIDSLKLRLPFFGSVVQKYCVSRFSRTLGTLVSGGIPLVSAIEISAESVGNQLFHNRLESVARKVREGESLWHSLEQTGLFPDIVVEMVKVGESTGSLAEMLSNISNFFDEEIDQELSTVVTLLEPAMLVSMGFIVVGMLMAIYLPLIKSYSATSF